MKFYSYYPNKKPKIFICFVKKLNNISDYQLDILLLSGGTFYEKGLVYIICKITLLNKNYISFYLQGISSGKKLYFVFC